MPSTSTSGPHHFSRTSWASCEQVREGLVGEAQDCRTCSSVEAHALVEDLAPGSG